MARTNTLSYASTKESFGKSIYKYRYLDCPIASIVATRVRHDYSIEIDLEDMKLEVLILVEAKAVLTSNIWTIVKLVNCV